MSILRSITLPLAAVLLGAPTSPTPIYSPAPTSVSDWPAEHAVLSVMTYNVKGLPWPIGRNRTPAIAAIGERLRFMRAHGVQPHIVLLQEAFVGNAQHLGELAGYEHVAFGPTVAEAGRYAPLGSKYADEAQWTRGERSGSVLDSGLVVLSDYPIIASRRIAFPEGACAGFDCLASKGVLITWIKVPGRNQPIAVVNTHLNSRGSAHVAKSRTDEAHAWQISAVREVVANAITADTPVIFGGDLNIGQVDARLKAAAAAPILGTGEVDDLGAALANGSTLSGADNEAKEIVARNKDRLISRSGSQVTLAPVRAWVPFPLSAITNPMSDHAGFVVDYRLD